MNTIIYSFQIVIFVFILLSLNVWKIGDIFSSLFPTSTHTYIVSVFNCFFYIFFLYLHEWWWLKWYSQNRTINMFFYVKLETFQNYHLNTGVKCTLFFFQVFFFCWNIFLYIWWLIYIYMHVIHRYNPTHH